jgi:hypothetical protein
MSEKIDAINLWELEARSRELLPQIAYDYYASGANDEITLRENRAAYERITLLPRMLVDVSVTDMSTTVLGELVSMPILIAPTALQAQTKDQTLILYESFHAFRIIPTDGRPHPEDLEPSFMGDSIGHWEGDTFVADVIGFNTWLGGVGTIHSEKLHVTERYTRTDYDTIIYEVKMEDPEVFTKPYNQCGTIRLRPNDRVREYECGENNEDIVRFETILKGQAK